MRTITRTSSALSAGLSVTAAAIALGVSAFAGTAAAAPSGSVQSPPGPTFGAFVLTSGIDAATLTCSPDGGTHPDPEGACDAIRRAGGDFDALPTAQNRLCPMYISPGGYPVTAGGFWVDADGLRIIDTAHRYGNGCFAAVDTDGVFGF